MDSEDPLFILYTRGSTGKPKGILHTTGGYLRRHVPDDASTSSTCSDEDVYWCTADVGWVTGHSYVVYGPLANGATIADVRGRARTTRDSGPLLGIIERHRVTIFYTAPTAIRAFMRWGDEQSATSTTSRRCACSARSASRSTPRRGCGTTRSIGDERCPIVDTWWQTETGAIMITPLPGVTPTKPGPRRCRSSASTPRSSTSDGKRARPEPGRPARHPQAVAVDAARHLQRPRALREAVLDRRSRACYFTGDGARRDEDGYFWIMGRVDDVINVAGHRLGTMEVESALVSHPTVAEAAVRRHAPTS